MLTIGVGLLVFGRLVGLGFGTVIIALCTGFYIQKLDGFIRRFFVFKPLIFYKKPKQEAEAAAQADPAAAPLMAQETGADRAG